MKRVSVVSSFLALLLVGSISAVGHEAEPVRLTARWILAPCSEAASGDLEGSVEILKARLKALNIPSAIEASRRRIAVKTAILPEGLGTETLTRVLTARGGYALHDAIEVPDEDTPMPERYEIPVWARPRRSIDPAIFIDPEPAFRATPEIPPEVKEPDAAWMTPSILVHLSVEDRQRFADFTEERIGNVVGVVVDGNLWSAPRVMERIFGDLHLQVDTTIAEARILAALVAAPPLEVCLEVKGQEPIDEIYVPPAPPPPSEPAIDPGALDLYRRFLDESDLAMRGHPASARVTMRAAILFDGEAVAEYLWQAPNRERIRTTISAVSAWRTLDKVFGYSLPAEQLIEFLEKQAERQRAMLKGTGRIIIGLTRPGKDLMGLDVGLFVDIARRPWELIEDGQVDLMSPPLPDGQMLVVSGIDGTPYQGEEVRLIWLTGGPHIDSLVVLGPQLDGRGKMEYKTVDGKPFLERLFWSTGLPGDRERISTEGWFDYREIDGYWLATSMFFEVDGDTTVAFEILDAEIDIDLDDVDWSDDISITDRDELIEVQKGTEAERQQELLDRYRKALEE